MSEPVCCSFCSKRTQPCGHLNNNAHFISSDDRTLHVSLSMRSWVSWWFLFCGRRTAGTPNNDPGGDGAPRAVTASVRGAVLPQECGPDALRPSSPWLPVCPLYERGGGLGLLSVSLGKEDRDGQVVFSQDAPKRWTLFLLCFPGETHGPMQVPGLP